MTEVTITRLVLNQINIPFKVKFRHASAERNQTSSLWVEAISESGVSGYGESCPRQYVTGETLDTANIFFSEFCNELCIKINSLASLKKWMRMHKRELDANPAAWCAVELAILDMLATQQQKTIESFLDLVPLQGPYQYSAVLGNANADSFRASAKEYIDQGFTDFKLKLSGNLALDQAKLATMREWDSLDLRVRVDANNLWGDSEEAISFLRALHYPLFAIEEPLQPGSYSELSDIANALNCKIILDESFLRIDQFDSLQSNSKHWLINLRVSKMGGIFRSLDIIEKSRELGIGLIVGAQVGETSLLTRAGLTVANTAKDILVAQEGAFGTYLLEHDICDTPLMFGKAGRLDITKHTILFEPGLGYKIASKPVYISQLP